MILRCVLVWVFCTLMLANAHAEKRVALVIGNGAYQNVAQLPNPVEDATEVAASLARLGFSVRTLINANFDDMRRALIEFAPESRSAEIAIIYFAGHGIEVGGQNWLIPTDAKLQTDVDAEQETISLKTMTTIVSAASKLGLVILDACRNNPFQSKMQYTVLTRAVSRGLARIEPAGSIVVAYAAKDGTTAEDGHGNHSPFTAALLKYLEEPGLEINFLFRNVRDEVLLRTGRRQEPFIYGSLSKEAIYLNPPAQDISDQKVISPGTQVKSAALSPPSVPAPARPSDAEAQSHLVKEIKRELKRIGCYVGPIDGLWGTPETKLSLATFSKLAALPSALFAEPSGDLRDAISLYKERVCSCPTGYSASRDGVCERTSRAKPLQKKNRSSVSLYQQRDAARTVNTGGYRTCGRNGCQIVPPGCHAVRGAGGHGLGGKIFCP